MEYEELRRLWDNQEQSTKEICDAYYRDGYKNGVLNATLSFKVAVQSNNGNLLSKDDISKLIDKCVKSMQEPESIDL